MTDQDPTARDDLLAAYLDGEATPAQRALVERDPALMERAELLQQVAVAVGEPVMPPPAHVRRAHIAAALDASDTAPNVTSLAARRGPDFTTIASIAAVALLILAVPIVLLRNGDGPDDSATSSTAAEAPAAESTADGVANTEAEGSTAADFAEDAPADEPAAEEAMLDDEAASDAPAEALAAEEADTDEESAEDSGDADTSAEGLLFSAPQVDFELVQDTDDLIAMILAGVPQARLLEATADINDLDCVIFWLGDNPSVDPGSVVVVGTALIAGDPINYVTLDSELGLRLVILASVTDACQVTFDDIIG